MTSVEAAAVFGLGPDDTKYSTPATRDTHPGDDGVREGPQADHDVQKKPWEKPDPWGTIRRSWRSVQRYIWDDPDKTKQEKKFLFKMDFFLLTYGCLGYFCKNLAQANINNAYVSGMKESLGMKGSELTYMQNVFTAGYVVSQLPAVIIATRVRPSLLVPTLECLWSIITFCCAAANTVPQLYALRFLLGICEGAFFPVIIYVIGAWYTKKERAKRVTLFYATATMATMFSGYLQAGAYNGLDGRLGHQGWQWLFIICGVISLPVGVMGYAFCPDFPENTRAFYLDQTEIEFARHRLLAQGYKPLGASKWDRTKIFRIMRHWQFFVLPLGYLFVQSSFPNQQPYFALWLKAEGHSTYEVNVWPTGQAALGVVVQVVAGMLSDSPLLQGRRWPPIVVMQGVTLFASVVLAIWDVPIGLKYAANYLAWASAGVPGLYYSWFPELMPLDHEMRGFLIAFSNVFSYVNQIWFSDAVWRTSESPRFKPGFIAATAFSVALILTTFLIRFLEKRDDRKRELVDSSSGDITSSVVDASADSRLEK